MWSEMIGEFSLISDYFPRTVPVAFFRVNIFSSKSFHALLNTADKFVIFSTKQELHELYSATLIQILLKRTKTLLK